MSNKAQILGLIGLAVVLPTIAFFIKRYFDVDLQAISLGILFAFCTLYILKKKKSS